MAQLKLLALHLNALNVQYGDDQKPTMMYTNERQTER